MRQHTADLPLDASGALDTEFAAAVLSGLARAPKAIPPRFFYDRRGSRLFEEITELPEYYPTRTEQDILDRIAPELAAMTPAGTVLVELGSGSSRKTETILAALPIATYLAIDVSRCALKEAEARLAARFPALAVIPVVADFCADIVLPEALAAAPKLGFFPGSTIGNFLPAEARDLLAGWRRLFAPSGRLLIGVDLEKAEQTLLSAYDDAAGVTARFNLNLLHRINRELGADFDLAGFRHRAVWNTGEKRIEMHLDSRTAQTVHLLGETFRFAPGETIHTENSYKYSVQRFRELAHQAGWTPARVWTDPAQHFSVHELVL